MKEKRREEKMMSGGGQVRVGDGSGLGGVGLGIFTIKNLFYFFLQGSQFVLILRILSFH